MIVLDHRTDLLHGGSHERGKFPDRDHARRVSGQGFRNGVVEGFHCGIVARTLHLSEPRDNLNPIVA